MYFGVTVGVRNSKIVCTLCFWTLDYFVAILLKRHYQKFSAFSEGAFILSNFEENIFRYKIGKYTQKEKLNDLVQKIKITFYI